MYARLVRYGADQPGNAESFVDSLMRRFEAMQDDAPDMIGSFLLTRRDDGEAIEITFWDSEEAAQAGLDVVDADETSGGTREAIATRRSDAAPMTGDATSLELWEVWQGRQKWKADYEQTPRGEAMS